MPMSIPEVQGLLILAHTEDLEHESNIKDCQEDCYLSSAIVSEHSSESPSKIIVSSDKELANYIKCLQNDLASESCKATLHVATNLLKEANEDGENSAENLALSNSKKIEDLPLSKKVNTIFPGLSDGNKSSEIILPSLSEKIESSEVSQPFLSEEAETSEVNQSFQSKEMKSFEVSQASHFEEAELSKVIQPYLSEDTESSKVIQPYLSEEAESSKVSQPYLSEEAESEVNHASLSEETESAEMIHPSLSEETDLTDVMQSSYSEEPEMSEVRQTYISEKAESSEMNQSSQSAETESSEVNQSSQSEETESSEVNQSFLSEEIEFSEMNLAFLSEETESAEVSQTSSEKNESYEVHQAYLSDQAESAEFIHPSQSEETESIDVKQSFHSEEPESSEVSQACLSEEVESNEVNQSSQSEETKPFELSQASSFEKTEIAEVNQAYVPEEIELTKLIRPVKEIVPSREIHPIHSEEADSTQVSEPFISNEVNSNDITTYHSLESSCCSESHISSSVFEIPALNIKSNPLSESESGITSAKAGEIQNYSEFPNALDREEFLSHLKLPEYQNATHLVLFSGEVIIAQTPPVDPILPLDDLQYMESFLVENTSPESPKHLSPNNDVGLILNVVNSNKVTTCHSLESRYCSKTHISSSVFEIPALNIKSNPLSLSESGITSAKPGEIQNYSAFPIALDREEFFSHLKLPEYQNATHLELPSGDVIIAQAPPVEPIIPLDDLQYMESLFAENPSPKSTMHLNTTKDVELILNVVNSNKVTSYHSSEPSCYIEAYISSSDFEIHASNNKSNPISESESGLTSAKSREIQNDSEFPNALDREEFLSHLKTPEYQNAAHLVFPSGDVIIAQTPPVEPIIPLEDLQYMESLFAENPSPESTKHLSSTRDIAFRKNTSNTISLTELSAKLRDWILKCTKWISEYAQHSNREDFIDNLKDKFVNGKNLVKQMDVRINTLLKATCGLPDPTNFLPYEPRNESISIPDSIVSFGHELQSRLSDLETEVFFKYERIVSGNEKLKTYEIVARDAKDLFDKLTEYYRTLSVNIRNFLDKIDYFCLKMEMCLTF